MLDLSGLDHPFHVHYIICDAFVYVSYIYIIYIYIHVYFLFDIYIYIIYTYLLKVLIISPTIFQLGNHFIPPPMGSQARRSKLPGPVIQVGRDVGHATSGVFAVFSSWFSY